MAPLVNSITLRTMTLADVAIGMQLKDAAGWNQLENDWRRFLRFRPEGCFVAVAADEVIGTVTSVGYGSLAWIGMVLVDPRWRRRGIGGRLLDRAIDSLADCETIKLDATPNGKQVYDQYGFQDEFELVRMVRPAGLPLNDSLARLALGLQGKRATPRSLSLPRPTGEHVLVRNIKPNDLTELSFFDTSIFGQKRAFLLRDWFRNRPLAALVETMAGKPLGYWLARDGSRFRQLGPLVAQDLWTASLLLLHALTASAFGLNSAELVIDAPLHNPLWIEFLRQQGFREERRLIRMFRGPNQHPGLPEQQWAICGPEWG